MPQFDTLRTGPLPPGGAGSNDPGPGCQHHLPTAGFHQDVLQCVFQHHLHQTPEGWLPGGYQTVDKEGCLLQLPPTHNRHSSRAHCFIHAEANKQLLCVCSSSSPLHHCLLLPQPLMTKNLTRSLPGARKIIAGRGFLAHFFSLSILLGEKIWGSREPGGDGGALSSMLGLCRFFTLKLGEIWDGLLQAFPHCIMELGVLQKAPGGRKRMTPQNQVSE